MSDDRSGSERRRNGSNRASAKKPPWNPWEKRLGHEDNPPQSVALKNYKKFNSEDDPVYHHYETPTPDQSNMKESFSGSRPDRKLLDKSVRKRKVEFPPMGESLGPVSDGEGGASDFARVAQRKKSQWDEYLNNSDLQTSIQSGVFKVTLHQLARDGEEVTLRSMMEAVPEQQRKRILNTFTDEEGITALHLAARHNHYDTCKLLIEFGAGVNAKTESRSTPLHYAARYRPRRRANDENELGNAITASQDKIVIALLASNGAHVNLQDIEGQTPLHCASIKGNTDAVIQLLKCRGIAIECIDLQGMTALHMAATHGHESIVECLIREGSDLHSSDNDQMTSLHFACSEGNIEIVRMILREGEKQGSREKVRKMLLRADAGGNTCLHLSVSKGHRLMVLELLAWCGDAREVARFVNVARSHNDTPLHIAASQGHVEIAKILIESAASVNRRNDSLQTPLLLAAQHNNFLIVELLLENTAELEIRDKDNLTPLLVVTKYGHLETISWLIENGADVSATDKNDKSCLLLAVEEKRTYAVKELLKYDSVRKLLHETDRNANSVLHVAARKGHIPIIKILLENGARIDPKNEDEATPVHIAAEHGQHVTLKELLDHDKTMLNSVDENANTALHLAATQGHTKCVQVLLEHGSNVGLRNTKQWTALDCASSKGWETTVLELIHARSPINPPRGSRTTPLHQACLNGHAQVVKLLLDWKADVGAKIADGRNPLDCAIDRDNRECVQTILGHNTWNIALRNAYVDPLIDTVTTPTRKLITKMPDMAEMAFSRCITNNLKTPDHPQLEVSLDYEFLDDMYTIQEWSHQYQSGTVDLGKEELMSSSSFSSQDAVITTKKSVGILKNVDPSYEAFDDQGRLTKAATTYVEDSSLLRHNHPLSIMVNRKREGLLQHPVVTALLQYKWNKYGGLVYYSRLVFLLAFVVMLNCYLLFVPPPYAVDFLKSLANRRFYTEFHSQHIVNYTAPEPCYSIIQSGAEYRGYHSHTESNTTCLDWDSTSTNSQLFPDAGLEKNYCRNPGSQKEKPWCYISYSETNATARVRETCDIPACKIFVQRSNVPLGATCHFPFKFQNAEFNKCLVHSDGQLWCSYVYDFDTENTKWGYCSEEDSLCSVEKDQKRPCGSPGTDRLNCEARDCCFLTHDAGRPSEWSECFQKLDPCTDRSSYCPVFKAAGYCETNPSMPARCPKTCEFCNETERVASDEEYKDFLYLMSIYPRDTFDPRWKPGCYYVRQGATKKWGDQCKFKEGWQSPLQVCLLALCAFNLLLLAFQLWNYHLEALGPIFFLEMILFILGLLLVVDFTEFDLRYTSEMESERDLYVPLIEDFQIETGLRQNWQWQCGVMALFLSWMNLLLYIRKIPYLGIYVVMFNDVFKTFVKFSLVFLLFIFSFAFTFHSLLENQSQFEQPFSSILKTTVMMVGEIDFGGIFFGNSSEYSHEVTYEIVTYIIFSAFIIIMMIIIMNLLVGLAVGDIIEVKEHATLERLKMQVELALEVEFSVPNFLRKRFVRKKQVIRPNKYRKSNFLMRALFQNTDLSSKNIVNAMNPNKSETEEIRENVSNLNQVMRHVKIKTADVDAVVREMMTEMREVKVAVETMASTSTARLDGDPMPIRRSVRSSKRSSRKSVMRKDSDGVPYENLLVAPSSFQDPWNATVLPGHQEPTAPSQASGVHRPYELTDITI